MMWVRVPSRLPFTLLSVMTREDLIGAILEATSSKIRKRVKANVAKSRAAREPARRHEVVWRNPDKRRVGWWANENAVFLDMKRGQNPGDTDIRKGANWKSLHRHVRKHQKTRKYMQYWDDKPEPQHVTTAGMKTTKARGVVKRVLRRKRSERVLYR